MIKQHNFAEERSDQSLSQSFVYVSTRNNPWCAFDGDQFDDAKEKR